MLSAPVTPDISWPKDMKPYSTFCICDFKLDVLDVMVFQLSVMMSGTVSILIQD